MADITMCMGGVCANRERCYRHTAPINPYRQSIFMRAPYLDSSDGSCGYFWANEGYRETPANERLVAAED